MSNIENTTNQKNNVSREKELDVSVIKKIINTHINDPFNIVLSNACHNNDISKLVVNHKMLDKINHVYSNALETEVEVADQKNAGLCWMFGGLAICRREIIKKFDLEKDFNFSVNYLMFWDKLERCNYFLNYIINNRDKSIESKEITEILSSPIEDSGNWHTFADLVRKYGLIPESISKRRFTTKSTDNLNDILSHKLREYASLILLILSPNNSVKMGEINEQYLEELKSRYMEICSKILIKMIGEPMFNDSLFDWTYYTKDEEKMIEKDLTPIKFYDRHIKIDFDDFVTIINDPRPRHPYLKLYEKHTREMSLNRDNIKSHYMLNLDNQTITELIMKQIDKGIPVWFACDVDKFTDNKHNVMDMNIHNYNYPFETSFTNMSKADRLDFYDSYPCHVMVIVGYDIDYDTDDNEPPTKKRRHDNSISKSYDKSDNDTYEQIDKSDKSNKSKKRKRKNRKTKSNEEYKRYSNRVIKFKVENSWGKIGDGDGYYAMSYEWMNTFGYEYMIMDKFLEKDVKKILKTEPTKLHNTDRLSKTKYI